LNPAQANSLQDPILKTPITKKGWQNDSICRPWVQTQVTLKKKKKELVQEYLMVLYSYSKILETIPIFSQWEMYIMKFYLVTQRNELINTTWIHLKNIILNERRKVQSEYIL
jgi:hypothetical protein